MARTLSNFRGKLVVVTFGFTMSSPILAKDSTQVIHEDR